jgi:hypothetical protein
MLRHTRTGVKPSVLPDQQLSGICWYPTLEIPTLFRIRVSVESCTAATRA